jgi:hypothetical protein
MTARSGHDDTAAERPRGRQRGLTAEVVGQDYVLHDDRTGQVHFLNETAALVWDLCDGAHTVDEIAGAVARRYAVPLNRVRGDVLAILDRMRADSLFESAA